MDGPLKIMNAGKKINLNFRILEKGLLFLKIIVEKYNK
jgi:hypothetical protein